jgi:hypothetical protein
MVLNSVSGKLNREDKKESRNLKGLSVYLDGWHGRGNMALVVVTS